MKKIVMLLLSLTVVLALSGCGSDDEKSSKDDSSDSSEDSSYDYDDDDDYYDDYDYDDDDDDDYDSSEDEDDESDDDYDDDSSDTSSPEKIDADGLELLEITESYEDDTISGTIKDYFYDDGHYILLDNSSNIYAYMYHGSIDTIAEDSGLQSFGTAIFENDVATFRLAGLNDHSLYYMAKYFDGETDDPGFRTADDGTEINFRANLLSDKEFKYAGFDGYRTLYLIDSDNTFYEGTNSYSDDEAPEFGEGEYYLDDIGLFCDWSKRTSGTTFSPMLPEGLTAVEIAKSYILSVDGTIYYHDLGSTVAEETPIESIKDMTFTNLYAGESEGVYNSYIGALCSDGKIYGFDGYENADIVFTANAPDGELQELHITYNGVIAKTDSGYYLALIDKDNPESESSFESLESLNSVSDRIITIDNDVVLLDNGCLYEIKYDHN